MGAFCVAESGNQFFDFPAEAGNGSLRGLTQKRFKFAECLLDRVEVGGIFRQNTAEFIDNYGARQVVATLEICKLAQIHAAFANAGIPPTSMIEAIKGIVLANDWSRHHRVPDDNEIFDDIPLY